MEKHKRLKKLIKMDMNTLSFPCISLYISQPRHQELVHFRKKQTNWFLILERHKILTFLFYILNTFSCTQK